MSYVCFSVCDQCVHEFALLGPVRTANTLKHAKLYTVLLISIGACRLHDPLLFNSYFPEAQSFLLMN